MANTRPNNNGTLTGRIATKDIKLISNGNSNVCRINMAADRYVPKDKKNDPNFQKEDFIPCVFFGDDAKNISQYGKAGKWIQVVYHLNMNKWSKDGVNHYDLECIVDSWNFMPVTSGTGNGTGAAAGASGAGTPANTDGAVDAGEFYPLNDEEELPF